MTASSSRLISTQLAGTVNSHAELKFASVTEKRVKDVSSFHVDNHSDMTNANLIGLVIYDLDGHREFDMNGQTIKEGHVYFRTPESLKDMKGDTYHAKLFYSLFGREWADFKDRMTVSGFARQNGVWKRTSRTLNGNRGEHYSIDHEKDMTDYEFDRVIKKAKDFLDVDHKPKPMAKSIFNVVGGVVRECFLPAEALADSRVFEKKEDSLHSAKNLSYELWKRNELNLKQTSETKWPAFNMKAIPKVFNNNFLKEQSDKNIADMLWQNLLTHHTSIKPFNDIEKNLSHEIERLCDPTQLILQKNNSLKRGLDIYDELHPKFLSNRTDKLTTYHLMNLELISSEQPASGMTLLNQLASSAKKELEKNSDYLLYRVQSQQSLLSSNFMRTAAFKDELYRLQVGSGLSLEQTQLLALYTSSRYSEQKSSFTLTAKPDPELLKASLQALQINISRDLSQNPDKSAIYQAVHQTSRKSQAITQESHFLKRHDEVFAQRIQQTCTEVTAVTGFCSSVASLSGSSVAARKINAIGSGVSQWLSGVSALSMGHPLMGLVGIGSAVCSLFGGLFGDDDDGDDGLSIVSNQISEVHHDLIKGFNEVLSQQIDIARGLSKQMVSIHQQTMSRFDHVDYHLEIIQQQIHQTYQYLTLQNSRISHQIGLLSQQLNETEINILKGLQAVHTDIVRSLQVVSVGVNKGLVLLDEKLCKGFDHLGQEVQMLTREIRAKIAEQMLIERQYFKSLSREQTFQSKELKHHSAQLDDIRLQTLKAQKNQKDGARKKKEIQLTKYAERVLLNDFPIETFDKSKLEYAFSKTDDSELTGVNSDLTPEEVLNQIGGSLAWQEVNPFDHINLLQSESKTNHRLVHLPTYQKNLLAMVKWLMQKKSVSSEELFQLKNHAEKIRNILCFCHELSTPDAIKSTFLAIRKSVTALGEAIEKQLNVYSEEFADQCQERLQHVLEQYEINRTRLKNGESKEVLECLADRMKQPLEINVFEEKVTMIHDKPQAYYVSPAKEEKLQYALPLGTDQLPALPKEVMGLEALGLGWIHFSYRFNPEKKRLEVSCEFQLSSTGKSYPLAYQQIVVNHESDIANSWRQFKWSAQEKIILSTEDRDDINKIYAQSLQELRRRLNDKIQQDLNRPILQAPIDAVLASTGLLHVKFKLIFERFYLNKDQILHHVLQVCLTDDKIKQLLIDYQGNDKHPFLNFKNVTKWYEESANHIIDALSKRTLYVDNVTLTNALLLLDNALLELMPKDERLAYLHHILTILPESAKAESLLLRGTIFATEKHDLEAALKDYRQASALNPDDNQIRSKYADALFALGDTEGATREYTEILTRMNDHVVPRTFLAPQLQRNLCINKGVIFLARGDAYLASGYPAAAFGDYQMARQLLPDQAQAFYKLGLSYQALDKIDLAIENYQKAIKLSPDDVNSKDRLANCLIRTNRKSEAFVLSQQLLEKFPTEINYKLQCAQLCPPEDKRCLVWTKEISKSDNASINDLLICCELYAKNGDVPAAKLVYLKIKDNISSVEQIKRCVALNLIFKDKAEYAVNKHRLLAAEGFFKQSSVNVNSEKTKTFMQSNRGSI